MSHFNIGKKSEFVSRKAFLEGTSLRSFETQEANKEFNTEFKNK